MKQWASVVVVVCAVGAPAMGDVFNMPPGLTSLETVTIGNAGNAGELSGEGAGGSGPDRICGSVGYTFNMGKYEITAGQYTQFLIAVGGVDTYGLYHTGMSNTSYGSGITRTGGGTVGNPYTYSVASDFANRPVNYVSWGDAARFANWLANGQPTGAQNTSTTEDGSYYLNGATSDSALMGVTRRTNARYVIPTEHEWHKAAYYDPNKPGGAGYWSFPTGTNTTPSNALVNPDPGNSANFVRFGTYTIGAPYYRTVVGEFENSKGPYGTFDQGGNAHEWNETIGGYPSGRGNRGGSYNSQENDLVANQHQFTLPSNEGPGWGFRVTEVLRFALTVTELNGSWGEVNVEPNLPKYGTGAQVTLTATPTPGKYFKQWEIYDPCHPNDVNFVTIDMNNVAMIVMNADRQVTAVFKCSSGMGPMLPLTAVGLVGIALVRRRR